MHGCFMGIPSHNVVFEMLAAYGSIKSADEWTSYSIKLHANKMAIFLDFSYSYAILGKQSFGVVVGSIPPVYLFIIVTVLSLMASIAGKLKEVNMKKTGTKKAKKKMTVKTMFVTCSRKFSAEFLLCLVAIGTGWTVGQVPPTLSRIA